MDRPFPQSVESERALLGGLIVDPDQYEDIAPIVRPEDFYRPDHSELFTLLTEMRLAGEAIDTVTVFERVQRGEGDEKYGGVGYVVELPEAVPSTTNLKHYAEVIREKAIMRNLIKAGQTLVEEAYSEEAKPSTLIERSTGSLMKLGEADASRDWQAVSMIVDDELIRIQRLSESTDAVSGTTTGFDALDDKLAGLHPTDLIILAARPAMGKTALALNLVMNAALIGGKAVGLYSLEMGRGQLVTRLLCCVGTVEGGKVRTGHLSSDDWDRLIEASGILRESSIHIDDTPGVTIGDVRARARRLKAVQPNLGLIVIDYLQLMQGEDPRASRQQQISDISRGLKILAKDLEVPVLALSQLNRAVEQRADKRPMVSDLRESGAIEQDADVIMFIYRDEIYNPDTTDVGLAEVIIAKQRNGPTGTVKLAFQGQYTRFDNLAEDEFVL